MFRSLTETDTVGAFILHRDAASLQSSIEEELSQWGQWLDEFEFEADTLHAKLSLDESSKSVAQGNRVADVNEEFIAKKKKTFEAKAVTNILKAQIKFLEKVYFSCKDLCERANKVKSR